MKREYNLQAGGVVVAHERRSRVAPVPSWTLATTAFGREREMTQRIETQLDEATVKELDGWRAARSPPPSRSEAVRLLLKERLSAGGRFRGGDSLERGHFPDAARLGALFVLERIRGFGPAKFRAMHDARVDPQSAIRNPEVLPFAGRTGDKLRRAIESLSGADIQAGRNRAIEQLERAEEFSASILTHGDASYPKRVYASNNPVPVLYVRGDPATWDGVGSVAVVGSRNTREPYASCARKFATLAAQNGMVVVSGFAMGADSIGHRAAWQAEVPRCASCPAGWTKYSRRRTASFGRNCSRIGERCSSASSGSGSGLRRCCSGSGTS